MSKPCSVIEDLGLKKVTKQCSVTNRVYDQVCQRCNDLLKQCQDLPTLGNLCTVSVQNARKAIQARNDRWSNVRTAGIKLGSIGAEKFVLYEFNAEARFTYNAKAGTGWYEFILPSGVKAEEGKLKSSQHGEYSVPNLDPKALVRETGFVEAKLYDSYGLWARRKKEAQPNRYVYVASKRLVDFLALSNALQDVGWAIFTEGATAQGSVDALKEQLLLESADILQWLREVGHDSVREACGRDCKGDPKKRI